MAAILCHIKCPKPPSIEVTDSAQIIISSGTFDFDPSKPYIGSKNTTYPVAATIADGYKVVDNGNGTWSVVGE